MSDKRKFWDKQAKNFNKADQSEIDALIDRCHNYLCKEDVLLDFGCATGYSTMILASKVKLVVGIDYSESMINYAKEASMNQGVNNTTLLATLLEDSRLKDYNFKKVVAFNVLHLLEDIQDQLSKIYDLLSEGGVFISYTPCLKEGNVGVRWIVSLLSRIGYFPDVNTMTGSKLMELMKKSGFKVLEYQAYKDAARSHYIVCEKR